ncbi:MAG: phosphatase PAP2 family protein [Bacteroidetes bacterium]|nr:phosphatase PAP2 family protein [Bacteroidota bacterium]
MFSFLFNLTRDNKYFFALFAIFMIVGAYWLYLMPKGELVLTINSMHTSTTDKLFYYLNFLGSGWAFIALVLVLTFVKYYFALIALITFAGETLIVQVLKRFVFQDAKRPFAVLGDAYDLQLVEGVDLHHQMSFPSGHTVTVMSMALLIVLISKRPALGIIVFPIALLVSFARIYLVQHFFIDVYFGTLLGIGVTMLVVYYSSNFRKFTWASKSILG